MNVDFKIMSDLVADAEDLVARVNCAQTPEVRKRPAKSSLSVASRVQG
jgi:hypothetical protein